MGTRSHTEPLTELVFKYRNKAYGSYQLRKKYLRTLLISGWIGTILILLIVLIPFLFYLLRSTPMDFDPNYIYEVEYIPFAPPEDLKLVELAKAHAKQPEEQKLVPVVADTLTPEEQKEPMKSNTDHPEDESEDSDTASYGTRGEETGRQAGNDTAITITLDVYPRYPGGDEARLFYLRRHVIYPKEAIDQGIQGIVMVVFVVEADGSVNHVEISRGIGGGCDEEAMRVTREMPKWNPGKRSGRPVRVMVRMPIVFRLPGK